MPTVTVDPLRCEGARDCLDVCEPKVFAMRKPDPGLPALVRLKVFVHGGKQAVVLHPERCTACRKCVDACPEGAIGVTG
jgi:4Fe-4S ferredoxin